MLRLLAAFLLLMNAGVVQAASLGDAHIAASKVPLENVSSPCWRSNDGCYDFLVRSRLLSTSTSAKRSQNSRSGAVPKPEIATVLTPEGLSLQNTSPKLTASTEGSAPYRLITSQAAEEAILELTIAGSTASDMISAYVDRAILYLPLGAMARILDLAVRVDATGLRAEGWVLDEKRTLLLDLTRGTLVKSGEQRVLPSGAGFARDGELYLRTDIIEQFLPLKIDASMRAQTVRLQTLEQFPFQQRAVREAERARLAARGSRVAQEWPRQPLPWQPLSFPIADVEMRVLSDSTLGSRLDGDLRLAGDLAFMSASAFLSANSRQGLTSALVELGRTDPDARLLGPLRATSFTLGDVASFSMPLGLRGVQGRGLSLAKDSLQALSVFDTVDFRGALPNGYEIELYRNDILLASARNQVGDQYTFTQVPLDFGLNIFRLVFYGPQGQRYEEVRHVTVGAGRLREGQLTYHFTTLQKGVNLFNVQPPDYLAPEDFGRWRISGELAYGLSSNLTTVFGAAWFEEDAGNSWLVTSGLRTGLGRFALTTDAALAGGGALALSGGVGAQFDGSSLAIRHTLYAGDFPEETQLIGREELRHATELDFNTAVGIGNSGLTVPLNARIRHAAIAGGGSDLQATLRATLGLPRVLLSNTVEYSRFTMPELEARAQLFGNLDLATLGRSRTRGRVSLGYSVLPNPAIVSAAAEVDHAVSEHTFIRATLSHAFRGGSTQPGLALVRQFDTFALSADASYDFQQKSHMIGLRAAFSLGRDPVNGRSFLARPGLSTTGGTALRAFHDMDSDGRFTSGDKPLPEVVFIAANQSARTDASGMAQLTHLAAGQHVTVQIDPASLPDIALVPATKGLEVVPRPGRMQAVDFPIVAVSEVEGTAHYNKDGVQQPVSGVRLNLLSESGQIVAQTRTEHDGFFLFEQVRPGSYWVGIEPEQARVLDLCLSGASKIAVTASPDVVRHDLPITRCASKSTPFEIGARSLAGR